MAPDVDRGRLVWWVFGGALGAAVLLVLHRFIGTFVFGLFLYYAARPVYRRVRPRVDQPSLAAALSLTILVLPALLILSYTAAVAYLQFRNVLRRSGELADDLDLGQYDQLVRDYLDASAVLTDPRQLLEGGAPEVLGDLLVTSGAYLTVVGLFLLHLFIMVAVAFYLLRDDRSVARWFNRRFADDRGVLEEYLARVDEDFNNIFFGNILNAAATGTIGATVYTLLDLAAPAAVDIPYAALVGLLAGIASLVPVVGMKLVYVPVAGYLFAVPLLTGHPEAMWFPVAFAAVSFVVVDTIPDLVLRPYVSGRSLHMGALMLAYVLGPLLFGWYGLFLAPMILVLVVHFARVVLPELIENRPIRPYAVDPTYLSAAAIQRPGPLGSPSPPPADDAGASAPDGGDRPPGRPASRSDASPDEETSGSGGELRGSEEETSGGAGGSAGSEGSSGGRDGRPGA